MRRRTFVVIAGYGVVSPLLARAQQSASPVVGFLHSAAAREVTDLIEAFRKGLREGGFAEDRNLKIEYRWADNDYSRLPALADELVARKVDVIATAGGDRTAIAAKEKNAGIPIVSVIGGDPVREGLVASLARPGGDVTGVAFLTASLTTKRLELLLELAPQAKSIALLANPTNPQTDVVADDLRKAVLDRGLQYQLLKASSEPEIDAAFASMAAQHSNSLVIQADPYFNNIRGKLIALAARYAVPAIHERSAFVAEGGLISYGTSLPDVYRQVGIAVAKVLKGAKPAELPVVQPTKFDLAINLKTAKTLGLAVPQLLLARADEVIE